MIGEPVFEGALHSTPTCSRPPVTVGLAGLPGTSCADNAEGSRATAATNSMMTGTPLIVAFAIAESTEALLWPVDVRKAADSLLLGVVGLIAHAPPCAPAQVRLNSEAGGFYYGQPQQYNTGNPYTPLRAHTAGAREVQPKTSSRSPLTVSTPASSRSAAVSP